MNGTRPRCRELANELSDSGRLVTLVRRLALRCNRDGKAFREREGVRLKAGGMAHPCWSWLDQILTAGRRGSQGPGPEQRGRPGPS